MAHLCLGGQEDSNYRLAGIKQRAALCAHSNKAKRTRRFIGCCCQLDLHRLHKNRGMRACSSVEDCLTHGLLAQFAKADADAARRLVFSVAAANAARRAASHKKHKARDSGRPASEPGPPAKRRAAAKKPKPESKVHPDPNPGPPHASGDHGHAGSSACAAGGAPAALNDQADAGKDVDTGKAAAAGGAEERGHIGALAHARTADAAAGGSPGAEGDASGKPAKAASAFAKPRQGGAASEGAVTCAAGLRAPTLTLAIDACSVTRLGMRCRRSFRVSPKVVLGNIRGLAAGRDPFV